MKKSAAKTLGAAALGAAFVAAAAGSASAAVPAIGLSDALGTVTGATQGLTNQQKATPEDGPQSDVASPLNQLTDAVGPTLGGLPVGGALGG
ncbi:MULTISPECIES: hypothetical protein [unclassified Streptomyces]|uniref:ATP-binding protein n=1 Tax=Streptomyces sp. R33 TaxID=3238629 RepID=A0AB39Y4G9_9ACTN|nr:MULTISPECIES: hypothetical protein [unclassified Streptomyces]KJY45588.1 hypothetical protein VR46_13935 [Streptomyces sp. NRRL S-444]KOY57904.1 hypothetical protein ADK59_11030 [Streptomyces sp. XY332]TDU76389.1 hypothetical protein EDD91_3096 [Streptomyces sp. KS 21]THA36014.1 hypothetical protein E6W17_26190 [Streptomyces sp. A1547]